MDIRGKKIAILTHNYFEQAELEEPLSTLKNAGAEVTIISADKKKLQGLNHVDKGDTFQADLLLKSANSDDYDALVLPGGAINADSLRIDEQAQQWVIDFLDSGRPVAAICHAPWLLVSADVLEGKRLTSYHTIRDDVSNAGGDWVDSPVAIDDNLITSRQPDDLPHFNDAIIEMLSQKPLSPEGTRLSETSEEEVEADARLQSLGYDKVRDELDDEDEQDILADEDEDDPEQLHLSSILPLDEQDGSGD